MPEDRKNFNFTTWKLDLMNAINADTRLTMTQRVVAHELLFYANEKTGEIYPSQELLGNTLGIKPRAMRTCISQLVAHGWLTVFRFNRTTSNRYVFDDSSVEFFNRRRQRIRDELNAARGTKMPVNKPEDRHQTAPHERHDTASRTGTKLPPNTSSEHVEGEHLKMGRDKKDIEVEQYARKGAAAYVAPDFDSLEIEIAERQAKARRREGVA